MSSEWSNAYLVVCQWEAVVGKFGSSSILYGLYSILYGDKKRLRCGLRPAKKDEKKTRLSRVMPAQTKPLFGPIQNTNGPIQNTSATNLTNDGFPLTLLFIESVELATTTRR